LQEVGALVAMTIIGRLDGFPDKESPIGGH
jgi:hypothetical protein